MNNLTSLEESFDKYLARGIPYPVNDKLSICIPTLGEIIDFGEQKYFSLASIFMTTSSDLKWQLSEIGADYEAVDDYEVFSLLFSSMRKEDMSLVFGDVDVSKLKRAVNNQTGEKVFVDEDSGLLIDSVVYEIISSFMCFMFNKTKKVEKAYDKYTKQILIEESKSNYEYNKNKPYKPQLSKEAVIYCNMPESKYNYEQTLNLPYSVFSQCFEMAQRIEGKNFTMYGVYTGNVDPKKLPKSQLNLFEDLSTN